MNSDSNSSSYDCEQQKLHFWNNGSRFSDPLLAKIYLRAKQTGSDQLAVHNSSVFRRCLRGNHAACSGFMRTNDYTSNHCLCPCHSLAEGLRST